MENFEDYFAARIVSGFLTRVYISFSPVVSKTEDFLKECGRCDSLPKLLERYTHSLLSEVSQTVACTRFHLIKDRLVCLLLMLHDRMKTDTFKMTQEILSKMLGVRREAVTLSARNLQQNKLINYSRGKISILNRAGLEAAACGCYFIIRDEYENFPARFMTK